MTRILIIAMASLVCTMLSPTILRAQMVTQVDAKIVATNWIELISTNKRSWGGSHSAYVEEVTELKREDRLLGYLCKVHPAGFIVVSLRRELAAVKVYSTNSVMDPDSDRGPSDLIKICMERVLDAIERQLGPVHEVSTTDLLDILEIDYRESWKKFVQDPAAFRIELRQDSTKANYLAGDSLLESSWAQGDPYNTLCPAGDVACTDCCPNDPWTCIPSNPTYVGCVATAGSQIMKYWNWPPWGVGSPTYTWTGDQSCGGNPAGQQLTVNAADTYDWAHMANRYVWDAADSRWEDENGQPLTQAHLDAVSELNYEVGVAVQMFFGVCGSASFTSDMEGVYENTFRYSNACVQRIRPDFTAVQWFERMKAQFNLNRPVHYRIRGHSIVGDGWQEIDPGPIRQYHMNYGWDDGHNAWYTLDALFQPNPNGTTNDEYMLEDIFPAQALGNYLSGTYPTEAFPYRYFDQDATSDGATFSEGQYLQFLPAVAVTCTSPSGGSIRINGSSLNNTRLFARGDISKGLRVYNGGIKLNRYGSIRFH